MGRPSKYTDALAAEICSRIGEGESVRSICEGEGMPGRRTVQDWLERNEDFRAKCARAWDLQADAMVDQQLEVANKVLTGEIDPQAAKVALSTYQWLASKRAPKRYGDRITAEHTGADGGPIEQSITVSFVKAKGE